MGAAIMAALTLVLFVSGVDAGPRPVSVRVVSASQRALLATHAVRVRVSVTRAATVRLAAAGSPVRAVRFRRAGARVVSLPLGAATRRALAACRRQRLVVRARAAGRPAATASRQVALDQTRCRPSAGGGAPPSTSSAVAAGGSPAPRVGGGAGASPKSAVVEGADNTMCDFLDPAVCLQPWPNNYFTREDRTSPTARRLNLSGFATPRNVAGKWIEPTDMNNAEGFSPGSMLVTRVPGLDNPQAFARTGAVPLTDIARYADPAQPIVVIDAVTGERHPIWSEIDSTATDPKNVNLLVRPAVNFREGHRYIVALRNLRRADGSIIEAQNAFRVYRDRVPTEQPQVEERRYHMETMFSKLAQAGIPRDDLYLVWDFSVASHHTLADRMLWIRDHSFAELGDTNLADLRADGVSPPFQVDEVRENPDGPTGKIARRVEGRFTVPCWLNVPGCPAGATFLLDPQGMPIRAPGNTIDARFTCQIPRSALLTGNDARPSLYGHGLFGSRNEIGQTQLKNLGGDYNFVFCATDWIGMACADLPTDPDPAAVQAALEKRRLPNCDLPVTATILQDVSNFPKLADRVQQGMLNFMFLGRAMLKGFNSNDAFRRADGTGVIDTTRLFYDGNSQGGIIGGALAAVEPDLDRASIGVPGMNYSTLLTRSSDFDGYASGQFSDQLPDTPLGLYDNYPNELERPVVFNLIQLLWDRAEANGYAEHMTTDPLPNTPPHHVLMSVALGDHQVANVAAEVEARTIGAAARTPYVEAGRSPYVTNSPFGLGPIGFFPYDGSAIAMWDSGPIRRDGQGSIGTDVPPTTNTPPRAGNDPHELPRSTPADREMKSAFLSVGGRVIDTCGGRPCQSVTRRE